MSESDPWRDSGGFIRRAQAFMRLGRPGDAAAMLRSAAKTLDRVKEVEEVCTYCHRRMMASPFLVGCSCEQCDAILHGAYIALTKEPYRELFRLITHIQNEADKCYTGPDNHAPINISAAAEAIRELMRDAHFGASAPRGSWPIPADNKPARPPMQGDKMDWMEIARREVERGKDGGKYKMVAEKSRPLSWQAGEGTPEDGCPPPTQR